MEEMLCQAPDLAPDFEPEIRGSCIGIEDRTCQAPDLAPDVEPETRWMSHVMHFVGDKGGVRRLTWRLTEHLTSSTADTLSF